MRVGLRWERERVLPCRPVPTLDRNTQSTSGQFSVKVKRPVFAAQKLAVTATEAQASGFRQIVQISPTRQSAESTRLAINAEDTPLGRPSQDILVDGPGDRPTYKL